MIVYCMFERISRGTSLTEVRPYLYPPARPFNTRWAENSESVIVPIIVPILVPIFVPAVDG